MISVEGNPNIKRCEYGHYYELLKHATCPYCKEDYKTKNSSIVVNTIVDDTGDNTETTQIVFLDR